MLLSSLVALTLVAADAKLLEAQKLLEAKDCDGIAQLFGKVEPKERTRDLQFARVLVQAATECRAKDKLLSLDFAQKAARLAPNDYGVTTAEAEAYLAVDQRTEAAKVLDDTIQDHPSQAARARLLRGQLACDEQDWAVASQVLKPIENDSEYGAQAKPLLAKAQAGLQDSASARQQLSEAEQHLAENTAKAEAIASARPHELKAMTHSGTTVWSGKGKIGKGGSKVFLTKNIKAGVDYILYASASCQQNHSSTRGKKHGSGRGKSRGGAGSSAKITSPEEAFGLDFKAYVGSLDPLSFDIDPNEVVQSRLPFRAAEDNPQIRVEDHTDSQTTVKCTISDVQVRIP
jgi:hypothetical protein